MSFEDFENLARLYVVGALEEDELDEFRQTRAEFGDRAEASIMECRKLNAAFALSLHPREPHPDTKGKLLEKIQRSVQDGH